MADKKSGEKEFMNELVSQLQEKGFIWGPSPEIYGGMAGFYTYAPLGKLLKNKVEGLIRDFFKAEDFWEVECPTIMPQEVWETSGHLEGFSDPLVECSSEDCRSVFRIDNLIEEELDVEVTPEDYSKIIDQEKVVCPNCSSKFKLKIDSHNLMMKTEVGTGREAYNRPETATTTYLPFKRYFDYFRKQVPFGVFQIGKAYRNEISPRHFMLRTREFTQAESQLFIFEDQKDTYEPYDSVKEKKVKVLTADSQKKGAEPERLKLSKAVEKGVFKNKAYAYTVCIAYQLLKETGLPEKNLRLRQHKEDEMAFYADDAWDIEIELKSFGWEELCGIHDRTDYDLKQHEKESEEKMRVSDQDHKKEIPHVLEIAFGVDRIVYSVLDTFYKIRTEEEGKTCFEVKPSLAPIDVSVFPLVRKDSLPEKAREVHEDLSKDFSSIYDEKGSIGKRYLRSSEKGIPFAVTVDYDTMEDDTVTIRERDSEEQVRVKVENLRETLKVLVREEKTFEELKKS